MQTAKEWRGSWWLYEDAVFAGVGFHGWLSVGLSGLDVLKGEASWVVSAGSLGLDFNERDTGVHEKLACTMFTVVVVEIVRP